MILARIAPEPLTAAVVILGISALVVFALLMRILVRRFKKL
jgi:hypothetical protein